MRFFLWNIKSPCPLEEKGPPIKSGENIMAAVDDIKKIINIRSQVWLSNGKRLKETKIFGVKTR